MTKDRKRTQESSIIGKVPPQDRELERVVLGALLIESTAYDRVSFLRPEVFYQTENRLIYEAIIALNRQSKPVDILTVAEQLRKTGTLEECGGPFYITSLSATVVSSAHIEHHSRILQDKYIQREAINISHGLLSKAYDNMEDIGDVLQMASNEIERLQEDSLGSSEVESISDLAEAIYENIGKRAEQYRKGEQTGIDTGLYDLNCMLSGWQKSELIVLAARPAMGKTALALHFAKAAALSNTPVLIYSLEMPKISLSDRLLLSSCDVNPDDYKHGRLQENDYTMINSAFDSIYHLPIYIDDNASTTMTYMRSKSRLLKKKNKCGMIIIDYLQLVSGSRDRNGTREQEISAMSREAKLMAKELDVPVILLSQLSRKVEERADKKPMLSDLRESGAIEQDADVVMFIYRPEYYNLKSPNGQDFRNEGKLIIAKNRNGKVGDVKFRYNDSLTKISDYH